MRADLIERVTCAFRVDVGAVCRARGRDRDSVLAALPRLPKLLAGGLVRREGAGLAIPDDARTFGGNGAAAFDAHLGTSAALPRRAALSGWPPARSFRRFGDVLAPDWFLMQPAV